MNLPHYIHILPSVKNALATSKPIVALESTVITHGLPYPDNLMVLDELVETAHNNDVEPALIIVIDGIIYVGWDDSLKERISAIFHPGSLTSTQKISLRELPEAIAKSYTGGTTVSSTMKIAYLCGIDVFATGGIGGVHRNWENTLDISTDMNALANIPVIVVSAGCKAILDVEATLEYLETLAVPVFGYKCDYFPLFYSHDSKYQVNRLDTMKEIVDLFLIHREMLSMKQGSNSGILIANPIPREHEIPFEEIEPLIQTALREAETNGIKGKQLTPFLLEQLSLLTKGHSITANTKLLVNNVKTACLIAQELSNRRT